MTTGLPRTLRKPGYAYPNAIGTKSNFNLDTRTIRLGFEEARVVIVPREKIIDLTARVTCTSSAFGICKHLKIFDPFLGGKISRSMLLRYKKYTGHGDSTSRISLFWLCKNATGIRRPFLELGTLVLFSGWSSLRFQKDRNVRGESLIILVHCKKALITTYFMHGMCQ